MPCLNYFNTQFPSKPSHACHYIYEMCLEILIYNLKLITEG